MTGEKFVRSLPYFRKRGLRRVFDECDDDNAIDFLEKVLQLEPGERMDTLTALKHPYLNKHGTGDDESSIPEKFEQSFEGDSEDWITCIEQTVEIKN